MTEMAFIAGFILLISSRFLMERALKRCSADEKINLIDAFARQRMFAYVPLLLILAASFIAMRIAPYAVGAVYLGSLAVLVIYVIYLSIASARKLRAIDAPAHYRRAFLTSRVLQVGALAAIFWGLGLPRHGA